MELQDHYVRLARHYLQIGDEDKARKTILYWRLRSPMIDEIHFQWAELCEELDMIKPAMDSYGRVLKINPRHKKALFNLARLLNEKGYHERATHFLKKLIKIVPEHQEAKNLLCEIYEKLGHAGLARAVKERTCQVFPEAHERFFPISIGDTQINRFMELFAGREVGFCVESIDFSTGSMKYKFCELPVSPGCVKAHLLGDITLAGYPMRSDNTVRFAGYCLRIPSRVREQHAGQITYLAMVDEKMKRYVIKIARIARRIGIPSYLERYGHQRYRIWFFFDEFEHFLRAKRFLGEFLSLIPRYDTSFSVEPILPTRPQGMGWKETCVPLPLGLDRASMSRSLFIDLEGKPYENQLKHLEKIRPFSLKYGLKRIRECKEGGKLLQHGTQSLPPLVEKLKSKCPVVDHLVSKATAGHMLRSDEKVVLFYTVGLIDEDGRIMHQLLEPTPDYNYTKVKNQWSRLKKNPISCIKIRNLLPEITVSLGCNCVLDLRGGKYPSPLLHVNPHLVPESSDFQLPEKLTLKEAAERYARLSQHVAEERKVLHRLEGILEKHFSRKGIKEYTLRDVRLKQDCSGERIHWILENR